MHTWREWMIVGCLLSTVFCGVATAQEMEWAEHDQVIVAPSSAFDGPSSSKKKPQPVHEELRTDDVFTSPDVPATPRTKTVSTATSSTENSTSANSSLNASTANESRTVVTSSLPTATVSSPADSSPASTATPNLHEGDLAYLRARLEKDLIITSMTTRERAILLRLLGVVRKYEADAQAAAKASTSGTNERTIKAETDVEPISHDENRREKQFNLLDELLRSVAENPKSRDARMRLASYYLFNNDPIKALRHLEQAGDLNNGDVFWKMQVAYCQLALGEYEIALRMLDGASEIVESVMPLGLRNGLFCEHVTALAQYDPLPNQAIGRGQRALFYFEVIGADFAKEQNDLYQVSFSMDLVFRDEMQRTVLSMLSWAEPKFYYRRPLRDIFMTGEIILPPELEPGKKYTLVIECRDTHANRTATLDIPFIVTMGNK